MFSRPILSDTQPKNGRVNPFVIRSKVSASGSAAIPKTMASATPKSRAKLAKFDTTISPPVDIIVIMTNMSQKSGVFSISVGAQSRPGHDERRIGNCRNLARHAAPGARERPRCRPRRE